MRAVTVHERRLFAFLALSALAMHTVHTVTNFARFKQPLWLFEYTFLSLRGALECTMKFLSEEWLRINEIRFTHFKK